MHFDVRSSCPSEQDLLRAFAEQVVVAGATEPAAWRVQVDGAAGEGATLSLRTPQGELASARTITSPDCTALAQAFAFIVLAHFIELRLIGPPSAQPADLPVRRVPDAARAPAPPAAEVRERALELGIALGGGVGVGVAPGSAAPALELSFGLGPPGRGWLARLSAHASATVREQSATDRVEHWRSGIGLEFGGRASLPRAAWLEGAAGGGVTLARVTALDLAGQPATWRAWPAVSVSVALGLSLGGRWALRWATAARLYPRTDHYRVEPQGVVAKSPKADVVSTLGLQFGARL